MHVKPKIGARNPSSAKSKNKSTNFLKFLNTQQHTPNEKNQYETNNYNGSAFNAKRAGETLHCRNNSNKDLTSGEIFDKQF